jgi:apolipoprotein N-acyltransferase
MPLPLRLVLAGACGVAVAVGFEPFALPALIPAGVAGLSLLCLSSSPRAGFALGTVFGTVFMLVLLPWLQVIGVDAWVALSLLEGLFYGLLGASVPVLRRVPGWPLWLATAWVAVEALRSAVPFGGFPWGRLSFATVDTPAAALFGYVGTAGTTFAVALVGTTLAWAVVGARRAPLRVVAGVLAALLLASVGTLVTPWAAGPLEEPDRVVRVAAVQGDVPGEGMDAFAERRAVLDNHVDATLDLADSGDDAAPDLVIWPENSTDIDPYSDMTVFADIQAAVDAVGVPVLVGAMVGGAEPSDVYNQGIVWQPGTGPGQTYAKTHPVPFGEYIPFRDVLARWFTRLDQIPRDMVPGAEPGVLRMAGTTIGDVICFEVAYDELVREVVARGAELIVVQTNNATYMGTGQVEQQFAISRLRAIETNRHVVVAATNGVSGIIAPDGSVVERAPVRTRAVLSHDVPLFAATTPALELAGPVEAGLTVAAAVSLSFGLGVGRRRRRPAEEKELVAAGRAEEA